MTMGDGSNLVTISCSDHHEALINGLWQSLVCQRDLDLHLSCLGQTVKAHRLVAEVFLPSCADPASLPETDSNADGQELESLIEFLYRGRVAVPSDALVRLLNVAKELRFKMLVDSIVQMQDQLSGFDAAVEEAEEPEPRKKRQRVAVPLRQIRKVATVLAGRSKKAISARQSRNLTATSAATSVSENTKTPKKFEPIAVYSNSSDSGASPSDEDYLQESPRRRATGKSKHVVTRKKKTKGKLGVRQRARYNCQDCDFKTQSKNQYDLHRFEHDPSVTVFTCEKCNRKFVSEVARDKHLFLNCRGGSRVELKKESRSVSSRRGTHLPSYSCTECDFKTRIRNLYELHRADHDPSIFIFSCTKCDKKFLSEELKDQHQSSNCVDKDSRHQCQHCNYKTGSLPRFQVHRAKHDPNIKILRCDYCSSKFIDQAALSKHKCVVMNGANLYSCSQCDYRTAHWRHFRVHQAKHDPNIKIYSCFKCRRRCTSEEQLSKHICSKAPPKPKPKATLHPCAECKFVAKIASQLKYHVQAMHSIEKAFKCEVPNCNYETGRKSSIKRHVAVTHQDIRKFVCEICGHRAVTQQNLDDHRRSHTGEKPFSCSHCDARFSHAKGLKKHVQRHISYERPHVCHICGSAFNMKYTLTSHLRNVHKTEMSQSSTT